MASGSTATFTFNGTIWRWIGYRDSTTGSVRRGTFELWPWFAAAALALLTLEWLVFHRGRLAWAGEPAELQASQVLVESYLGG